MFKKIIITLFLIINCVLADEILEGHYKIFAKNPDELFMNTVAALNRSKYEISEIQSRNGYILFSYQDKFFLLTVTKKYKNQTEIKILPQNSDYTNSLEIANDVFNLIDIKNQQNPMKQVK